MIIGGDTAALYFKTDQAATIYSGSANVRRISFPASGNAYNGVLHGEWETDATLTTSDRRLKTNIQPLQHSLKSHMRQARAVAIDARDDGKSKRSTAIEWVLRELRPVSFSFRSGPESKGMKPQRHRYGFVAQEVEQVMPNLITDTGGQKAMLYQDLIAMITLAAQNQQERLEQHHGEVSKLRSLTKRLGEKLGQLQKRVTRVLGPLEPGSAAPSTN